MRLIISFLIDFLGWMHQLADINACSLRLLLDELDKLLQVVLKILALFDRAEEHLFVASHFGSWRVVDGGGCHLLFFLLGAFFGLLTTHLKGLFLSFFSLYRGAKGWVSYNFGEMMLTRVSIKTHDSNRV